ncbi:unnamed protein product [Polarella glacialis]|uniref:Uncharacterized protein n=1 Tax=Polarella glacialis TaxID=89957 RepID=A0A813H2T0_POLGL|nr:unnamed protein product [Polarella glacialis]
MEELAEIIRNPTTKLQEWDQCITHNQKCRRLHGQKLTQGILHVLIAGSPCADYSKWGKVLQSAGELYDITFSQIDPADDCGFPIHRKRVYLVAHRRAVVMRRYKDIGFPEYVRQVQIKSTHKLQVFLSAMTAGITTVTGSKMKRLLRYRELFSNHNVFDLNQSPDARPRKNAADGSLQTLTTNVASLWSEDAERYFLPITEWAASALGTEMVVTTGVSNTAHCRMAGNSMHAAAVGRAIAYLLFFLTFR